MNTFKSSVVGALLGISAVGVLLGISLMGGIAFASNNYESHHNSKEAVEGPRITHGVAAGDVTSHSAVIWSRADQASRMHVTLKGKGKHRKNSVEVHAEDDFTGKLLLTQLRPGTEYEYQVWFSNGHDQKEHKNAVTGHFKTAAKADAPAPVQFAWGGDLAGQNVCRDKEEGFPIFKSINAMDLDFFIGLGDMIYADGTCEPTGRYGNEQVPGDFIKAADLTNYWAHWKYNREDSGYLTLLQSTNYYSVWDDHEVVNDFGPLHDTRDTPPYTPGQHLLPIGMKAMLDYNPIPENAKNPHRMYRNIRWGKHLEIFYLDNRQYRDANLSKDSDDRSKTMLGREQLTWLKEKLAASDATWKLIVSNVPLSIPTGFPPEFGRDGWGNYDQETGFEYEVISILKTMEENQINAVWITTDVHFAEVFRYTPFVDKPEFQVHEFVTGPINAGLFPNKNFDTTLGTESLFFYGPEGGDSGLSYEEAKAFMNYGHGVVDENGLFTLSVRDIEGNNLYEMTLIPN